MNGREEGRELLVGAVGVGSDRRDELAQRWRRHSRETTRRSGTGEDPRVSSRQTKDLPERDGEVEGDQLRPSVVGRRAAHLMVGMEQRLAEQRPDMAAS